MTTYTITGPDGKDYSIDGPAGQTQEQVIAKIQEHQKAPVDRNEYYGKLSGLLDNFQKQLMPSWEHNKPSYSPYKPAQPGNMPNDAVNPVGTDAQMTAAIPGAGAARLAANTPRLQPAPQGAPQVPQVNMNQMPTQQAMGPGRGYYGAQPIPGAPGNVRASEVLPGRGIQEAGDAAQSQLLQQLASQTLKPIGRSIGHLMGGPIGGKLGEVAAKFGPKMLGFE